MLGGEDYLLQMTIPNVYFHIAMAYAILRHNGVDMGKMDFLGPVNSGRRVTLSGTLAAPISSVRRAGPAIRDSRALPHADGCDSPTDGRINHARQPSQDASFLVLFGRDDLLEPPRRADALQIAGGPVIFGGVAEGVRNDEGAFVMIDSTSASFGLARALSATSLLWHISKSPSLPSQPALADPARRSGSTVQGHMQSFGESSSPESLRPDTDRI